MNTSDKSHQRAKHEGNVLVLDISSGLFRQVWTNMLSFCIMF